MSDLKFDIDVKSITDSFDDLKEQLSQDIVKSVGNLATMTHAKVLELASNIGSLSQKYMENVEFDNPVDNLWIVTLKSPALFIEEGRKCVVYGGNKDHMPKVLTPDGEIPITDLKVGMMVLNQYGKWTDVVEIYDEHLVEKSKLLIYPIKVCRYMPNTKRFHKRERTIGFARICPVCKYSDTQHKINKKRRKFSYCPKCLCNQEVYKVEISGHLNSQNSKNWSTMFLTGDHRVMTEKGWKEIKDFVPNKDSLLVPSWTKCKKCNKDTFFGNEFCYDNEGGRCSSSFYTNQTLKKGNHVTQNPNHRAKYLNILKKIGKENRTEETVANLIKRQYTCDTWSLGKNLDFYREFPVKVPSNGKYKTKYFYLDFYCPKLNLAIEIDGKAFHCSRRDAVRDKQIKKTLGCDIIRIPARNVWKKDFYKNTLKPILKNHSNDIKMIPFKSIRVSRKILKPYSPINRRWDITVREGESFVCNKVVVHNSGFMQELLDGKSGKVSKDGKKYAVIPFTHNQPPSRQSANAQQLAEKIKQGLRQQGINWKKIEKDADGSPRLGRLHTTEVFTGMSKKHHKTDDPGIGVSVYQTKDKSGNVRRDVMTFRVITEDHKQEGLWVHPGMKGKKLMDEAMKWAMSEWETKILPEVMGKYK